MTAESQNQLLPEGEVLRINGWEAAGRFFLGIFVVFVGLVYLFSKRGPYHPELSWLVPALSLMLIVCGIYITASSRAGLIVEADGITVQKAFGHKQWRWSELRHFELTNAIYGPSLRIDLAAGEDILVRGFRTRSRQQRDFAQGWVAQMNRRAEASGGAAPIVR